MKKFLSLVLALVMTMSLVTISAGAKDFDDNADITYVEAVDVMSEVGIVDGDKAGNFNPTAGLTRGAAAKIICNLILGPTTAAELNADTAPYPDVAQDSTFAGYIAYCQKEGIISGYADGTFKPANPLTGYAFMKMLLGALGYDPAVEGYTGANWSINVAKQAIGIGLNAGLVDNFNGSDFVTREEAMLYAFNTLQATMVDYDTTIVVGDITIAGSKATDVANNARTETLKDDNKMQFAEKYFTKLTVKADTDAFERPANTWVIGKETIGTYVDYTKIVAEYTTAVSGKELYDVTGKTAFNDYEFESYVDGAASDFYKNIDKNNKADIADTKGNTVSGNGALTQVFVDNDNEAVVVTVINTYLAQATGDYNAKKDTVTFDVYGLTGEKGTVSGEDFDIEDVEDEDFVLVNYSEKTEAIEAIGEVEIIADTEITSFKAGKDGNLTVDGTKYSYNKVATYNDEVLYAYTGKDSQNNQVTNLKDLTYNVYLDQYGYVIGVDLVETPDNYLFVTGLEAYSGSNLSTKNVSANAIFVDGTAKVIEVNVKDSEGLHDSSILNSWYSYTVNKNDVYTLTKVGDASGIVDKTDVAQYHDLGGDFTDTNTADDVTIDKKHISLYGADDGSTYRRVYGNDATIYLLAETDVIRDDDKVKVSIITGVDEVITGVKNASLNVWNEKTAKADSKADAASAGAYTLYKGNGYIIATVVVGESDTISSNLAYVVSDKVSSESYNKTTGMWTWTRDVVIDGEKVEVTEVNDTGLSVLKRLDQDDWVVLKYTAAGDVKKVANPKLEVTTVAQANAAIEADTEDVIVLNGTSERAVYSLKGSTLFDETNNREGFLVAEDVKVVLTQTYQKKTTTTYDEGIKVLEATLKNLNEDKDKKHQYTLDAVIENGMATVVVIVDKYDQATSSSPSGSTVSTDVKLVKFDATLRTIELKKTDASKNTDVANAIKVALADNGYTWTTVTVKDDLTVEKVEAVPTASSSNATTVSFTVTVK